MIVFDSRLKIFGFGVAAFLAVFVGLTQAYRTNTNGYRSDFQIQPCYAGAPAGLDFMWIRDQAIAFKTRESRMDLPQPPLYFATYNLFTHLSPGRAYHLHSVLMLLLLYGTVFFSIRESGLLGRWETGIVAIMITAALYHSFWFQYEQERGNNNTVVAFSCSLSLYAMSRGRFVTSVLALTVATQWRYFPVVLAPMFLFRGGIRVFLSFLALNVAALFAVGPEFVRNISERLHTYSGMSLNSKPDHSLKTYLHEHGMPDKLKAALVALSGLFGATFLLQGWRYLGQRMKKMPEPFSVAEVGLIGMAFHLMALVPAISLPYKLVIQIVPFLMFISRTNPEEEIPRPLYAGMVAVIGALTAVLTAPTTLERTPALLVGVFVYALAGILPSLLRRGILER